jgi:hypothetical protein
VKAMVKVFVENLHVRNLGNLRGDWFDLPVSVERVYRKLGLDDGDEYAITDYESPFPIGEYEDLDELNELAELLGDLPSEYKNNLAEIKDAFFSDVREAIENYDDIVHLLDVYNDRDYGNYMIEEGLFEVPERLRSYIDEEALGRDCRYEGNIIYTDDGAFYK